MTVIDSFVHAAYLYESDDEVLGFLVPFIRDAHEHGDAVIVDLDDRKTNRLRRELGSDADDVEFIGGRWYTNPASAIREYKRRFESLMADSDDRTIRTVGELPPTALNGSWQAWRRYEAAINVAFNGLPVWGVCLFDRTTTPPEVLTDVLCTHPQLTTPAGPHIANELYAHPRDWLVGLPPPPQHEAERTTPHVELVDPSPRTARAAITPLAVGLSATDRDGLLIGVSEVVTNALAHGEPPVTLRAWATDDQVVVTIDDSGPGIDDPFAGLIAQRREMGAGGLGLWMTHQVCTDVALINHRDGFQVRLVAGDIEKQSTLRRLDRLVDGVLGDVSDAVIVSDLHLRVRSWNPAAERLYGWSEEEVRGRPVLDVLYGSSSSEKISELWANLDRTGRSHDETTQVARSGSVLEVLSSTRLISDEAGDPLGVVSVNRTAADARSSLRREQDSALATRLSQALADDEFVVHYQPVVDLVDGRLITLEALVRWEHPERGTVMPGEFLDTAERSGLIVELGERVLDKACRQVVDWRRSGIDVRLSVNVSTRQLTAPGMVERFTCIMRDAGFDPKLLWLEVTESALVEELDKASDALRELVDLGVGVSINDFGTGWASLTYLRSFPVHALKIDRSFVTRAGHTASDTAIVRSILSLGAELDLFVVAEGIETEAQHEELKKMGCAFGQGYLFGRPVPGSDVPMEWAARIAGEAPQGHDLPGRLADAEGVESELVEDARQAVDLLRQDERLVAGRDELTGLADRRVLDSVLPRATSGSVVMIDVDHVADVNDRSGDGAGDSVLVSFAEVLTDHVRTPGMACRIGGAEFAVVLADADICDAAALVDRVRAAWSVTSARTVRFSAGVGAVGAAGGTAAMAEACRGLYEAKALGGDRTETRSLSCVSAANSSRPAKGR